MSTIIVPSRATSEGETRIRLTDVDWATFQVLASRSRGARFAYDRGVLEIMSPGPLHEQRRDFLDEFVRILARSLRLSWMPMGSTTWVREEAARGIEADECFYFDPEKIDAANDTLARESNDAADYPSPDLVVEVDISRPKVDRAAIYATIRVAEVWRFDGRSVVIERLNESGTYSRVTASGFLPVRDEDVRRWLVDEDRRDRSAWEARLAEWVIAELAGEHEPRAADEGGE